MALKRLFSTIPIFMIGIFLSAQTTVELEWKVEDDAFEKSQSILPIYKYESSSIEPYSKFGLEIDTNQPWHQIKKLPELEGCRDTGYTYIYFAGANNAVSQGYLLTIIGNYGRHRKNTLFHLDRNNDFDFTNDGPPDTISWRVRSTVLEMENAEVKGAHYGIKLTRFKYGENVRYKNLLTEHYKTHSGNKKFTNINYCYREQRYNTVVGNFKSGSDSFSIGIKDINVDGIYNQSCTDLLYVGPYKSQVSADELRNIIPTISNNVFEWNNKKYRIKSIETTGKYLEIEQDANATLSNRLEISKRTPNFEYFNVFNKQHKLRDFKKQEIYLYFWDIDSQTDQDTIYLNKINDEYKDEIKIITLNHGDKPKEVKISFYYDKIQYPVGYSNTEIAQKYFVQDVPHGFYLGKKSKLKADNVSPKDMYALLLKANE